MLCTLTAVPYSPGAATVTRSNVHPNPAARDNVANWTGFAGTAGAGTFTHSPVTSDIFADDGTVLPTRGRARWQQNTSASSAGGLVAFTALGTITPGTTYLASMYVSSDSSRVLHIGLQWMNAAGAAIATDFGPNVTVTSAATGYQRLSVSATAPTGTSYVQVVVFTVGSIVAGTVLAATALLLTTGSTLRPYFDGATRPPTGSFSAWVGAPNASSSTLTERVVNPYAAQQSTPDLALDYSGQRESASVEHPILGRPDPVHATGPLRTRKGTLEFFYSTLDRARAAARVHEAVRVMLRDTESPELDMYYVPRRVELAPHTLGLEQCWRLTVEYTEVYATAGLY